MCDNKNPLRHLSSRLSLELHLGLEVFEQEFGFLCLSVQTHFTCSLASIFLSLIHRTSYPIRLNFIYVYMTVENNATAMQHYHVCTMLILAPLLPPTPACSSLLSLGGKPLGPAL